MLAAPWVQVGQYAPADSLAGANVAASAFLAALDGVGHGDPLTSASSDFASMLPTASIAAKK